MKRTWTGLAAAVLMAIAARAAAEPANESLAREGVDLRRKGRDAEALAVFERALAVDGSARTRAQVALAEQALGFLVEAERDLSAALAAGDDAWFREHRASLQASLEAIRGHLATLDVQTNVAGAEVWVNGSRAGTSPLPEPVRVAAGVVAIEVRATGYEPLARSVQLTPQAQATETMTLIPSKPIAPPQASPAPPAVAPPPWIAPPTPAHSVDRGSGLQAGAWLSLGAAVVFSAGAGVALLVRDSNVALYNDDGRCLYGSLTRDERCGGYRDAASTAQTLAIVQLGLGLAALGTSAALFVAAETRHAPRAAGATGCDVGMGVSCRVSF